VTAAKFRINDKPMTSVDGITVFNTDQVDTTKQKMFFGPPLGVQRYDKFKYPIFDKLTQTQLGFFWRPEEVSLQKDRADYQTLNDAQKHIFTSNLKYQILLDSVQGRGPGMAFLPYCSLPELEGCMNIWQTMEMIHSRSYTHIIKNVYPDPSVVFDHILDDEKILSRAQSVTRAYDEFLQAAHVYDTGNMWREGWRESPTAAWELHDIKRKLYRAVANVYILEGIRFYVSFACSFAFGELKLLEGSAKIIGLIARDESQHMTVTQNILNKWRDGDDPEMAEIAKEEEDNVYNMFKQCVEEEKLWAEYLFKDGSIIGLNDKLLAKYVEWTANRRLKSIGLKAIFDTPISNNPLPWTAHWLSSKGLQVAPQETEVESYMIGSIKQDVKKDTFAGFKL
jgi:ribonucleotide reductase beta subunit family protein with ferritin-like domain|tara:strand:- start:6900 stop:8084 length:1185 start_codon:yes stop_codon:yes gene_type:complete